MMLLAFDTSTPLGSVALGRAEGEVLARRFLARQQKHASALVPAIEEVLDEAGLGRGDLGGVVVGAGPGSFTGVRVAAATAKGLVHALGLPLWAVSSLAAGAVTAGIDIRGLGVGRIDPEDGDCPRLVLFDARGDRVYAACYRILDGRIETRIPPRATRLEAILEEVAAAGDPIACGSGARRHRERLEAAGLRVLREPAGTPTADSLLRIVSMEPEVQSLEDPARWEPEYLRAWKEGPEKKAG